MKICIQDTIRKEAMYKGKFYFNNYYDMNKTKVL